MNEEEKFDWMKECQRLESINADLLEACKTALHHFNYLIDHDEKPYKPNWAIKFLTEAIAKAEGREEK